MTLNISKGQFVTTCDKPLETTEEYMSTKVGDMSALICVNVPLLVRDQVTRGQLYAVGLHELDHKQGYRHYLVGNEQALETIWQTTMNFARSIDQGHVW